jgi:hypothetical protein
MALVAARVDRYSLRLVPRRWPVQPRRSAWR